MLVTIGTYRVLTKENGHQVECLNSQKRRGECDGHVEVEPVCQLIRVSFLLGF